MSDSVESTQATRPARSPSDFNWLRGFLDSIGSYAPDVSMILESQTVTELFHYTDLGGLRGIVDTGDLWLTHLRFSNDNEELTHGMGIVRQKLDERMATDPADHQPYLERLKELLDQPVAMVFISAAFAKRITCLANGEAMALMDLVFALSSTSENSPG